MAIQSAISRSLAPSSLPATTRRYIYTGSSGLALPSDSIYRGDGAGSHRHQLSRVTKLTRENGRVHSVLTDLCAQSYSPIEDDRA